MAGFEYRWYGMIPSGCGGLRECRSPGYLWQPGWNNAMANDLNSKLANSLPGLFGRQPMVNPRREKET
jgi:hypothetical protein